MQDRQKKEQFVIFDSRPAGEPVNPYVVRIAPQRGLDYANIQRLIKESAELISVKKSED